MERHYHHINLWYILQLNSSTHIVHFIFSVPESWETKLAVATLPQLAAAP
jgi:hypothetical protein